MSSSTAIMPTTDWILEDPVANLIRRAARQLSRSPGFTRSDHPDIEQDFRLHLFRMAAKYDAARSKSVTFAARIIKNKAVSMARKVDAGKRSYRRNSVSLDALANRNDGMIELAERLDSTAGRRHTGQRTRTAAELANQRIDLAEANRDLPAPLKKLAALLSHVPQFAAGEVLGMSRRETARHVETLRAVYMARGLAG